MRLTMVTGLFVLQVGLGFAINKAMGNNAACLLLIVPFLHAYQWVIDKYK